MVVSSGVKHHRFGEMQVRVVVCVAKSTKGTERVMAADVSRTVRSHFNAAEPSSASAQCKRQTLCQRL